MSTNNRIDVNILIGNVSEFDKKLFFGDEIEFQEFPWETKFPTLMKELGIFKSTSDARKNGWDKDIPMGFTDILKIGKWKSRITIFKTDQYYNED